MKEQKPTYKAICPICFKPCFTGEDLTDLGGEGLRDEDRVTVHRHCKERVKSADDFLVEWTFARDNWLSQNAKIAQKILKGSVFGIAMFKETIPDIEIYIDNTVKYVSERLFWFARSEKDLMPALIWRLNFEIMHELAHRQCPALCGSPKYDATIDHALERILTGSKTKYTIEVENDD